MKNKTEAQVNFVMIAYYNPNETYEEHDEYSYDDMNKVEYEMLGKSCGCVESK